MPINSVYHGTNWFVDPEDWLLYRMDGPNITGEFITLDMLTQGALATGGLGIIQPDTGRVVQPLLVDHPAELNVMPTGQLLFQRTVSPSAINAAPRPDSRYGASGTFTVTLPTGEERVFDAQPWLSGSGQQVLVREGSLPGDDDRFRAMSLYDESGTPLTPDVPDGWRYATSDETVERGMIAELLHTQSESLKEMVALGMVDDNGDPITDTYEAAHHVAVHMDTAPSITSVLPT